MLLATHGVVRERVFLRHGTGTWAYSATVMFPVTRWSCAAPDHRNSLMMQPSTGVVKLHVRMASSAPSHACQGGGRLLLSPVASRWLALCRPPEAHAQREWC